MSFIKNMKPILQSRDALYTCAAADGKSAGVVAVNFGDHDEEVVFEFSGIPSSKMEVRIVDKDNDFTKMMSFEATETMINICIKANSFEYLGSTVN